MGQKDLYQSDFYENNYRFADVINGVFFEGKEIVKAEELEEEFKPYVNDFKLNLFDYHNYNDFKQFKTENRLLFEVLSIAEDKKKMLQLLSEEKEYGRLDEESAKAILGILGTKINIEKIKTEDEKGEVRYDMCKAIKDIKRDERREGRREGRLEGRREGRQSGELAMALKNVKNLMKNQKITFEDAVAFLEIPKRLQGKMKSMI